MQYRQLGKSHLKVSALCLGTMMFGDQTPLDEARAIAADARENGVNYIDTADVYTTGASEAMVGELLQGQRHDWVLATKLGNRMSGRPNEAGFSRSWMLREIEASLKRLRTDHVDILYLHRDNNGMDLEEPLRALDAMLRDGKIRYWGVSNFRGWRIAEAVRVAQALGMPGPVVCQP
jgi:aryl-alcohol dehydrogenase-like predicted oxidoreductase